MNSKALPTSYTNPSPLSSSEEPSLDLTPPMRLQRLMDMVGQYLKLHFYSSRTMILWPVLCLFILGSCWGLSDPNATLPGGINADTPYEVLFIASGFILLSATLGVVLVGFDGISRKRSSGVLAIELSQTTHRGDLGLALLLGTWAIIAIPTLFLSSLGIMLINLQMGLWPSVADVGIYFLATSLILFWYSAIQLLASSWAEDMGGAIAIGIGTWLVFTLMWVLVTVLVAAFLGVDVSDTSNESYLQLTTIVDLFSPNGVYQMLLESHLSSELGSRVVNPMQTWLAAIVWTVLPIWLFLKRMRKIS